MFPSLARLEFVLSNDTSPVMAILSVSLLEPAIKVPIPVIVARGISGNTIGSCSTSITRFRKPIRLFLEYQASFGEFFFRDLCATNSVRKAFRETMVTAMQVSTICQKFSHVRSTASVEVRILDIRIKEATIMMIERQKKKPKTSFWSIFIWICQRIRIGIAMTKGNDQLRVLRGIVVMPERDTLRISVTMSRIVAVVEKAIALGSSEV